MIHSVFNQQNSYTLLEGSCIYINLWDTHWTLYQLINLEGNFLKFLSYDLLLGSNKGVVVEDVPPIDLLLFSKNLWNKRKHSTLCLGGESEEPGSLADDVEETPSPLELLSVREIKAEWIELIFLPVILGKLVEQEAEFNYGFGESSKRQESYLQRS